MLLFITRRVTKRDKVNILVLRLHVGHDNPICNSTVSFLLLHYIKLKFQAVLSKPLFEDYLAQISSVVHHCFPNKTKLLSLAFIRQVHSLLWTIFTIKHIYVHSGYSSHHATYSHTYMHPADGAESYLFSRAKTSSVIPLS